MSGARGVIRGVQQGRGVGAGGDGEYSHEGSSGAKQAPKDVSY